MDLQIYLEIKLDCTPVVLYVDNYTQQTDSQRTFSKDFIERNVFGVIARGLMAILVLTAIG